MLGTQIIILLRKRIQVCFKYRSTWSEINNHCFIWNPSFSYWFQVYENILEVYQQIFIFLMSGGIMSKIKMLAGLVSSMVSLSFFRWVPSDWVLTDLFSVSKCEEGNREIKCLFPFLLGHQSFGFRAPPLTSFNFN